MCGRRRNGPDGTLQEQRLNSERKKERTAKKYKVKRQGLRHHYGSICRAVNKKPFRTACQIHQRAYVNTHPKSLMKQKTNDETNGEKVLFFKSMNKKEK